MSTDAGYPAYPLQSGGNRFEASEILTTCPSKYEDVAKAKGGIQARTVFFRSVAQAESKAAWPLEATKIRAALP